jgi:protein-L-isoaspartate(D-aspartate) O-methyltransferase
MVESQVVSRGIKDERVLAAMRKISRHLFVEEAMGNQAYGDYPLPIGEKQTISQPYIVALMTEALELKKKDRVLEIGTGSGYQTAILAEIAGWVYTIERIKSLLEKARKTLDSLHIHNVTYQHGDGTEGWLKEEPFDAILVTSGSPNIPQPLIEQLDVEGRLVIPVGDRYSQNLKKVTKKQEGTVEEDLGGCRFVNLIGKYGWNE